MAVGELHMAVLELRTDSCGCTPHPSHQRLWKAGAGGCGEASREKEELSVLQALEASSRAKLEGQVLARLSQDVGLVPLEGLLTGSPVMVSPSLESDDLRPWMVVAL